MEQENRAWPFASFREGDTWVEDADGPPGVGLRHGLLDTMRAFAEEGYVFTFEPTEKGDLLAGIYAMKFILDEANEELSWLMAEARYKGASWEEIALALNVTRQAAHRRFASLVEDKLPKK